ncbi:MAG: hypothetical protein ACJ0G3_02135 [Dehalococcoidia bacterium]|jgi:hypothetical protein|nr:hypothetical protein [Chloroflexota bacterium]MBE31737.1 hypothetical protein [Rickettsiales bacterium]|tara:strand:+ start:518 stop:733 length:216 start_codon:yes stop_codon:yes gene_type:complete
MAEQYPKCLSCDDPDAVLVPLSDFGGGGAPIHYKAWVCTEESCTYNLKIRNGDVYVNEPISDGSKRERRDR